MVFLFFSFNAFLPHLEGRLGPFLFHFLLGALKINFDVIEPNAPPVKVQGHNTSSTSIWVDWDTVPVADQNGIILTYTVTYTALTGGIPRTAVVSAPTTHVTLRSLEEYTNYSIFVFASTMKGDGNASAPIIVTTDQDSKLLKKLRCLAIKRERGYLISYKKVHK